jgi:hypothetical protein
MKHGRAFELMVDEKLTKEGTDYESVAMTKTKWVKVSLMSLRDQPELKKA